MQHRLLNSITKADFPADFIWGVATSAFQIEGSANGGRGACIWDEFCNRPNAIVDASNALVACDHYHRWQEDVELIAALGVSAYRFSIAWSRVQPLGEGAWNEQGFEFYEQLINALNAKNIECHVTLYHWDLPLALQQKGGWENSVISKNFSQYAAEVAKRFGNKVASISTFNEPWVVSILGYEQGIFAPGIQSRKRALQVAHQLLVSHGLSILAMRELGISAKLGIVLNQSPIEPASDHPKDLDKARFDDGYIVRWYMDTLLLGQYPSDIVTDLADDAPQVAVADMKLIAQPLDFIGINYYTRNFSCHKNAWDVKHTGNQVTAMGWEIYPQGLTQLLCRLQRDYYLPDIYITENGAAFEDLLQQGEVEDTERVNFLQTHIQAVKQAIDRGVRVKGYFAWSLMDNFEWSSGYSKRFGLVYVDYASQKRYPKSSAKWYRGFLQQSI